MKKAMLVLIALVVITTVAMAQTIGTAGYNKGQGIINMDKLGAHQNGGRGCVGCHAPHSGARGNGGSIKATAALSGNQIINGVSYGGTWSKMSANTGDLGDEELWGQDLGAILAKAPFATGKNEAGTTYTVDFSQIGTSYGRMNSGIAMCLSCHDGEVAKGAMMTNQSFEQAAGLLPSTYGSNAIPTLLGDDGGAAGNYNNDHPIGPQATLAKVLGANKAFVTLDSTAAPTKLVASGTFAGSAYQTFQTNYGLPTVLGARAGAGWAVDSLPTAGVYSSDNAYVVCTTCHTPHTMFKASASASNPIDGQTTGYYPSFFFLAAPYNPAAQTQNGAFASSATQFCRQCHFQGAGGSNESIGITNIKTAF